MTAAAFVLGANELEEFGVGRELRAQRDRERPGKTSGSSKVWTISRWPKSCRRMRSVMRSC